LGRWNAGQSHLWQVRSTTGDAGEREAVVPTDKRAFISSIFSVAYLSENVGTMTRRMDRMTNSIDDISVKMNAMENPDPMRARIRGRDASMRNMTITGDEMHNEIIYRGGIYRPSVVKDEQFFPLVKPEPS
jgi:hypothetical protein